MRYKMYLYRDNRELQENRYWKCGVQSFNNLLRQGIGLVKDGKAYACKIVDLKVGSYTILKPNMREEYLSEKSTGYIVDFVRELVSREGCNANCQYKLYENNDKIVLRGINTLEVSEASIRLMEKMLDKISDELPESVDSIVFTRQSVAFTRERDVAVQKVMLENGYWLLKVK